MIILSGIHYLQTRSEIFPATTGGAKEMCQELNVEFLGSLPLDPRLARCCDEGKDFINEFPESPAVVELKNIVKSKIYFVQKISLYLTIIFMFQRSQKLVKWLVNLTVKLVFVERKNCIKFYIRCLYILCILLVLRKYTLYKNMFFYFREVKYYFFKLYFV